MSRYRSTRTPVGHLRLSAIAALLVGASSLALGNAAQAATPTQASDSLQFTAAGHILSFAADGIYVASGDHMLRVEFAGTPGVRPVTNPVPASQGRVQPLERVTYPDLWPGVSLSYERVAGGIVQSLYRLEPGADAGQIRLRYNAPLKIEAGGSLRIEYENGYLHESAPIAWQDIGELRLAVEVSYRLLDTPSSDAVVGFALGRHDPAYPVTIDPVLEWNTFLGSIGDDTAGWSITVAENGDVYVIGTSSGTWGSPVSPYTGSTDAFVAKLNSNGVLQWNTFLGCPYGDHVWGMALDASGGVYVTGSSWTTWGSPVNPHAGSYYDVFAAKLNSDGVLQWNTFMGCLGQDFGGGIGLDGSGNIYVGGWSPETWGSPVNAHAGYIDTFVAKLNSNGVRQWNTFLGSPADDFGGAVAVDDSGNAYVCGESPASWGSPVAPYAGGQDVFAAKLNSNGVLQWNTFLGSSDGDHGGLVAVDGSGGVYITGVSSATWGSPVAPYAGADDVFAAALSSDGVLRWNTFLGSSDSDLGGAITVDDSEAVYVSGVSRGTWGSPVSPHSGGMDGFVAELDNSGVYQWHTFMGGAGDDDAGGIAVSGDNTVLYVAGSSAATWGSPVNAYAGGSDVFAAKLVRAICGNGVEEQGEDCDDGNTADGDCCSSTCQYEASGSPCGDPGDTVCDDPDTCDGAGSCQANHEPSTTECRATAGACDVAENCDGAGACPADGFEPSTTECRADTGECDVAESCTGSDVDCPPNGFEPVGTPCEDNDVCTEGNECDGAGTCGVILDPCRSVSAVPTSSGSGQALLIALLTAAGALMISRARRYTA